jgi:hypothetical protein
MRARPTDPPYRYLLFQAIRARLGRCARLLPNARVDRLIVLLAPLPDSMVDDATRTSRAAVMDDMGALLELEAHQWIAAPASMADRFFCTPTHLNPSGRDVFTRHLARLLNAQYAVGQN